MWMNLLHNLQMALVFRHTGVLLLGLTLLVTAAGCRNCDLVEAELRSRDHELRELRDELERVETHNDALQRELHSLRQSSSARISPELASQTYTLKSITLGRQTGGYDNDNCPGDEALQVVLEPRDVDGHTIKAPGTLLVQALEVSREGTKKPLCWWQVGPEKLRRSWRSGLLSTGYVLVLPWKVWPGTGKLRVLARFQLADGRVFEADKDVTVRLTPQAHRKPPPADAGAVPGGELPPDMALPPPRQLDTPSFDGTRAPSMEKGATQPASLWQNAPPNSLPGAVRLLQPVSLR